MAEGYEDAATIADAVAYFMTNSENVSDGAEPWEVIGLDIGEVMIATHTGQHFRLSIEDVTEEVIADRLCAEDERRAEGR